MIALTSMLSTWGAAALILVVVMQALSANLLGIVQTRLELLATDIAEERERIITLLVLAVALLTAAPLAFNTVE